LTPNKPNKFHEVVKVATESYSKSKE